jgi:Raf kinase inhibitor-like YbhB/YbcL family protein
MQSTTRLLRVIAIAAAATGVALSASAADLKVRFGKTEPGNILPPQNAACVATRHGVSASGRNMSPPVEWSKGPSGTKSYALALVDPTVPVDRSGFNKESVVIAADAPRADFVHWVLADIPASQLRLPEGADGEGVTKGGLPLKRTLHGLRGQNGAGDGSLKNGPHGGYMGPCPPWNDERIHEYQLTVYALDVAALKLPAVFNRAELLAAAKGHILASGTATVNYTINERARK